MLEALKESTRELHEKLESVSFAREIMSQQITRRQYIDVLKKNKLAYSILESKILEGVNAIGEDVLVPFLSNRLVDINKDLSLLLEVNTPVNKLFSFDVNFEEPAKLIGALYVLEGARLGSKVIVKALSKNPELSIISDFHFYAQKEINIRERWLSFRSMAEKIGEQYPDAETKAIDTAKQTFQFFYQVYTASV